MGRTIDVTYMPLPLVQPEFAVAVAYGHRSSLHTLGAYLGAQVVKQTDR